MLVETSVELPRQALCLPNRSAVPRLLNHPLKFTKSQKKNVPDEIESATKPQIDLALIDQVLVDRITVKAWTFDEFCGREANSWMVWVNIGKPSSAKCRPTRLVG